MDLQTPSPTTTRRLVPHNEAAAILCISPRTLRALCGEGKISVVRVSKRRVAFDPADLEKYITAQRR